MCVSTTMTVVKPCGVLPNPPTRVAFLLDPSPFSHLSGYTNRFVSLAEYLLSADVCLLAAHAQHLPIAEAAVTQSTRSGDLPLLPLMGGQRLWFWFGFKPYDVPTWRMHSMLAQQVGLALEELRPEVIHVATPGFAVFGGVFWSWYLDVPLVFSYHTHALKYLDQYMSFSEIVHGAAYSLGRVLVSTMMQSADLVLCPSPELVQHLTEDCGVDVEKVQVWKKGVDADTFNPKFRDEELRKTLLGTGGKHLLLMVARLAKEKNIEELKPWLAQLESCVLAIVGGGPDEAYYKEVLADEIQAGSVVFTGVKRDEELSRIFASADVFVMPSRSETLGFVVLEAMSSGVPVVATSSGGIPSIIHSGIDSFLYEEGNVVEAANLTRRLLEDVSLYRQIAEAARAEAESMSWAAAHRHVHECQYTEAIRRHAANGKNSVTARRYVSMVVACARGVANTSVSVKALIAFLVVVFAFVLAQCLMTS